MEVGRKKFVGGNWKSNNTLEATKKLVTDVLNQIKFDPAKVDLIVAPIFMHIPWVKENIAKEIHVSAQNCSKEKMGAFTGEVSALQIKDFGLDWVILGHSERRKLYGETNDLVGEKVQFALASGLKVIACVGEKIEEREANQTMNVIIAQLEAIKNKVTEKDWDNIVIAYEPVWAIGTGKTASNEQAQEVHVQIRKWFSEKVNVHVAAKIRIIYGGSVTNKNAPELISQPDIDGFLVGGAALKPEFQEIVLSCNK